VGRPSPSPCDKTNCALEYDSPPELCRDPPLLLGEGWAVGRFPGQFLRRTELIKESLRPDDERKWWCLEPLQFLVEQQGIPAVATPVSCSRFPDRSLVC